MDRDRDSGNGAAAGYAWTVDPIARDRLTRLEEQGHELEQRVDAIEKAGERRQGRLDNMAAQAKAVAWVVGILGALGSIVLGWLNLGRH